MSDETPPLQSKNTPHKQLGRAAIQASWRRVGMKLAPPRHPKAGESTTLHCKSQAYKVKLKLF